jgi:hypothetical protein
MQQPLLCVIFKHLQIKIRKTIFFHVVLNVCGILSVVLKEETEYLITWSREEYFDLININ